VATVSQWIEGARPRTLPAAVSPVLAGSGAAWWAGGFHPGRALLALAVSLALQVGVNYANDYSDGIRGTDAARVGPLRLVGSGAARPEHVKAAAFGAFGVAAVAGLALVVLTGYWWLLALGAAAILAAWFYTGGTRPYGYAGLGEVFVFVFFGLVPVIGTAYVQLGRVPGRRWRLLRRSARWRAPSSSPTTCETSSARHRVGKRTRSGSRRPDEVRVRDLARIALAGVVGAAAVTTWWACSASSAWRVVRPVRAVLAERRPALIRVLKQTGLAELVLAAGLALGWVVGR
jgi:1,4-dihydroxy-2-naphthoate octaprenyltransferase